MDAGANDDDDDCFFEPFVRLSGPKGDDTSVLWLCWERAGFLTDAWESEAEVVAFGSLNRNGVEGSMVLRVFDCVEVLSAGLEDGL